MVWRLVGYPDAFKYAVVQTLENEVFKGNEDAVTDYDWDPGGVTKYGISQKANPDVDVPNLTKEEAIDLYYHKYWMPLRLNGINSKYVAAEVFDTAVILGPVRAGKILQEAVNLITVPNALKVDGIVGDLTITEVNKLARRYEASLCVALNLVQGMYFIKAMNSNPKLGVKVAKGWMKRLIPPREILR